MTSPSLRAKMAPDVKILLVKQDGTTAHGSMDDVAKGMTVRPVLKMDPATGEMTIVELLVHV